MWWKNGNNPGGSRMVKCAICKSPRDQRIFWRGIPLCSNCYDRERTRIRFMPRKPSVWWRQYIRNNGIK